ncbi:UDP-N-acetylglucosamine transferase subunit ALG14-like [Clavelina lepadiformis]|uniref:UDP-N-acetylglucosamine transferase subunit ALG14-like n=1 Tax=Clavelina lepadiformis TaxID=159417 RepID=UPI00404252FD
MLFSVILLVLIVFVFRIVYVCFIFQQINPPRSKKITVLAIAGSGGHTTELVRLMSKLPSNFNPRFYVVATTDNMSEKKLTELEHKRNSVYGKDYHILKIPRSREVAQSWLSTIYTTFIATIYSFPVLWNSKPDLILCNGPGTCIPLCVIGLLFKVIGICQADIIYIESICRVTTMSLSGKLLYLFTSKFFIQWPNLLEKYPKAIYLGGRII